MRSACVSGIAYVVSILACAMVYVTVVLVMTVGALERLGVLGAMGMVMAIAAYAIFFTLVPFIILRAGLAWFDARGLGAFIAGGGAVGVVFGSLMWALYGFTYVGETGALRMATWIGVSALAGAASGSVQWRIERWLAQGWIVRGNG